MFGYGPWQVALIQEQTSETTKVVVHSHICLLIDAMFEASKRKEKWVPLLEIGPFTDLEIAKTFAQEWTEGARGLDSRIRYGESLFIRQRHHMPTLVLAVQTVSVDTYASNRQWNALKVPMTPYMSQTPSIKQIQHIEKSREK